MSEVFTSSWLASALSAFDESLLAPEERRTVELTLLAGPDGDVPTVWRVEDGHLSAVFEADAKADFAMTIPWKDATAIVAGDLDPAVAYMQGRLKGSGDMALLLRLLRLGSAPAFKTWMQRSVA